MLKWNVFDFYYTASTLNQLSARKRINDLKHRIHIINNPVAEFSASICSTPKFICSWDEGVPRLKFSNKHLSRKEKKYTNIATGRSKWLFLYFYNWNFIWVINVSGIYGLFLFKFSGNFCKEKLISQIFIRYNNI